MFLWKSNLVDNEELDATTERKMVDEEKPSVHKREVLKREEEKVPNKLNCK